MADHPLDRKAGTQLDQQPSQHGVLDALEGQAVTAFQLDPDGEVVCSAPAPPRRHAGVPGPLLRGNETDQLAVTADEVMRRDAQMMDRRVERVPCRSRRLVNSCSTPPRQTGPAAG